MDDEAKRWSTTKQLLARNHLRFKRPCESCYFLFDELEHASDALCSNAYDHAVKALILLATGRVGGRLVGRGRPCRQSCRRHRCVLSSRWPGSILKTRRQAPTADRRRRTHSCRAVLAFGREHVRRRGVRLPRILGRERGCRETRPETVVRNNGR